MDLLSAALAVLVLVAALFCVGGLAYLISVTHRRAQPCTRSNGVACTPDGYDAICGPAAFLGVSADEAYSMRQSCAYMCQFYKNLSNSCSYTACWRDFHQEPYVTLCGK